VADVAPARRVTPDGSGRAVTGQLWAADERPVPPLVDVWRTWQFAQSLSARTVAERVGTLARITAWSQTPPDALTVEHIAEWLAAGDWCANTRWSYHRTLSVWFLWLQKQGHRVDNPMMRIGTPRRPRSEPRPIADGNLRRLLSSRMHRRTRAMILLACFEGLRVHETAKIKGEHLDLEARTMVVTGKGGVTATLPLHHSVIKQAYLMPAKGFWFPGTDHGHQHRESVGHTIKQAMIRAGVPGSAHQIRHYFGTALVRAGVDLRTVQVLMRHQNLTSTAIYTQVADEQRVDGINRLDPFGVGRMRPVVDDVTPESLRQRAAELLAVADKLQSTATAATNSARA
jgi:site-specific recombinase XerD